MSILLIIESGHAQNKEATDSLTSELQEVIVTAKQPATKLEGTTLVSTIPGTNLADLGTALDVLDQLPMIKVTDNTVSVIGKSNIEIFIDGHPMRDESELQHLLSSNLKKVELLMTPGAAYESTTGAVLKITTRRKFVKGLSLAEQFQIQRRRKWSLTEYLALSYRVGDWEFFANGSINRINSVNKGTTTNSLIYEGQQSIVGSSQYSSFPTTTVPIKAGFNHSRGKQSFGLYYRYNPERGDFVNCGAEWLDENPEIARDINKHVRAQSHLASLYYENTFADRYLLHYDGDFRSSDEANNVATTYPLSTIPAVNSTDKRTSTLWAGKLYMNFPIWNGEFSVGTQDSHTRTTLDYRMLNADVGEYIPSSSTESRQTSAALFASWSRIFGKMSLTAGARYEYVDYDFKVNRKRNDNISRREHTLTPDISLGYSFSEESQISVSYKMATEKPPYSQLTGALNYTGQHEIEGGNPGLRDERMHDVRMFGMWKGFMFQADYQRSLDTYAFVKQIYPADNLQLLMHPVNIDVSALSLYLVWSRPLKFWTPSVTAGIYRQWLTIDNDRYDKPIFSYYFDNTFALPHGWTVTANINGRSQGDMHTNRFGGSPFTMDISVGKTFLNKSLTVKLSATDIFNTANDDWTMNTYGVFVDKRQKYDRRGLALNIIYNFQPRKSKYKGSAAAEAEMERLQ
ncbi:MAG: outer membrane beta-barrel family protein [Muribaculaceae bacterium]|nr:outer membrane beta-barrel family protein [Muribaculaceae bacterium]